MEISGRLARQILLFSLFVLIIPMIMFPARFGTPVIKASLIYVVFELGFYLMALIVIGSGRMSFLQIVQSSGLCLMYRFVLGLIFGLLIMAAYPMKFLVALTLGLSSYLPAIIIHVAAAPFILRPLLRDLYFAHPTRPSRAREAVPQKSHDIGRGSAAAGRENGFSGQIGATPQRAERHSVEDFTRAASSAPGIIELNGFERATKYIGEDGSVMLAAAVDREGLLLGNFKRGDVEPEDWAPFAVLLLEKNIEALSRINPQRPEKIDMLFKEKRIVIASGETYYLMVVAERAFDDVLNIRINQGLEMIRKYVSERYSAKLFGNTEKAYVRSIE